jgi:hypothetical protein
VTVAAPGQSDKTVDVALFFNDKPYTDNTLQFAYIRTFLFFDINMTQKLCCHQYLFFFDSKGSNVALAVGLSVAAAAILIAGAVVLFFWLRKRQRKRGLVVELQEPDYVKVTFCFFHIMLIIL